MDELDEPVNRGESTSRGAGTVFAGLGILLMFYVLMIGPVARLYESYPRSIQRGFEILYWPLEQTYGTPLQEPIDAYIELWRR